ncbi:hypothetical protein H5J22_06660 [Cetobacterium sp. 8H]|uniref:hypothetical protein n=1 Tax=Cetobacterium sp. 8H TaxID=2759681 RepID=UPI00163C551E|nr:hypothetical protein [Cetobacterium sp. 8H]MBC2851094.1 hypothetical protein [Cetobacterium sp. 8H]
MYKNQGITFIETIISFGIILILINPIYSGMIVLKKNMNKVENYHRLENEMEKARAFYKKNSTEKEMKTLEKSFKILLKKNLLEDNLYKIEILIDGNDLKRKSVIYVYKQK